MWPWSAIADLRERVRKLEQDATVMLPATSPGSSGTFVQARDVLAFLACKADLRWHWGTPGHLITRDEEARQSEIRG